MTSQEPSDRPEDRLYDRQHNLWVHRDAAGAVRVGIDSAGLAALGELAYVTLHEPGTAVARGDSIGTLEAAKMTTPIFVPVSGVITARNDAVQRDPMLVNREPYAGGWLIELDATDWDAESNDLAAARA